MQIMNIRLTSRDPNVPCELMEVPYRKGFEMFGHKFVCHKNLTHKSRKTVSHYKTGMAIEHGRTYKEAKERSIKALESYCQTAEDFEKHLENYAKNYAFEQLEIN
jgi:hypothetical protein